MQAEALENSFSACIAELPAEVRKQLEACPAKGQGVNPWLFKTALMLHEYFSEDEIEGVLLEYVSCDGREREIRLAVANSGRILRGETPSSVPPAVCDLKNHNSAGGVLLYGVSPFPKSSLNETQKEAARFVILKAWKAKQNSDNAKKEGFE